MSSHQQTSYDRSRGSRSCSRSRSRSKVGAAVPGAGWPGAVWYCQLRMVSFETKRHIMLVMELCAGGDLLNFVRKRKKCDEPLAKVLFK